MSARLVGVYNAPAAVTLLGLALAVAACALAIGGRIELAVISLMYAGLCDLFDGVVARRSRLDDEARAFGVELDSIVDMASFGVAPVVLAICAGLSGPLGLCVATVYTCAAAERLAHFNTHGVERRRDAAFYAGLPVTYAALIFPVAFMARGPLGDAFPPCLAAITLAVAAAFVVRVPIRKPSGPALALFPVLALALTGYWLFEYANGG